MSPKTPGIKRRLQMTSEQARIQSQFKCGGGGCKIHSNVVNVKRNIYCMPKTIAVVLKSLRLLLWWKVKESLKRCTNLRCL